MPLSLFEGPEKKVELAVVEGHPPLRALGEDRWREVVRAAGADVVSLMRGEHIDAYLLSESSLFVYDEFVTMITCGRTNLVSAVDAMLEEIDPADVSVFVYERKKEHFPREQPTSFFDDARLLREWLPGRAICFGAEHEHSVRLFHSTRPHLPEPDDRTLEVLMHGIDPAGAARFERLEPDDRVARDLGLSRCFEGYAVDEHVFAPTGYSFNAISGWAYTTLHVTPQRLGSYVSFETNAPELADDLEGLLAELLEVFAPESFDVVLFEPSARVFDLGVPGYRPRTHVREEVCGYHVTFQHWFRPCDEPGRAIELQLG